ncbi:MAG: hypothetical protein U1E76_11265 [Planctomycetota bacterium]
MMRPIVVPVHPRVLQLLVGLFAGAMAACVFTVQAHLIGIARGPSDLWLLGGVMLAVWALPLHPTFAHAGAMSLIVAIAAAWLQPWALRGSLATSVALALGYWVALRIGWSRLGAEPGAPPSPPAALTAGSGIAFALGLLLLPWRLLPLEGFFGGASGVARLGALLGAMMLVLSFVRSALATARTSACVPARDAVLAGLLIAAGLVLGTVTGAASFLLAGTAGRMTLATISLTAWLPMAISLGALLALALGTARAAIIKLLLAAAILLAPFTRVTLGTIQFGMNGRGVLETGLAAMSVPALAVALAAAAVTAVRGARPAATTLAALAFAGGVIVSANHAGPLLPLLAPRSILPAGDCGALGILERRALRDGAVVQLDGVVLPDERGAEARAALAHVLHGFPQDILLVGETGMLTEQTLRELGTYDKDQMLITPRIVSVPLIAAGSSLRERLRALAPQSFDLIVQEAVDPLRGESGSLLTADHFALLKSLLHQADADTGRRPGALMMWIGLDRLRWEGLGLLGRTFVSVFDNTTLWLAEPVADVLTIGFFGRDNRLEANWPAMERYFREHRQAARLRELKLDTPLSLCGRFVGDEWFVRQHFDGTTVNDDAHPRLAAEEFWRTEAPGIPALNNAPLLLQFKEDLIGRVLTPDLPRDEINRIEQSVRREAVRVRDTAFAHQLLVRARLLERMPAALRPVSGAKVEDPRELESRAVYQLSRLVKSFPDEEAPRREIADLVFAFLAQGRLAEAEDVGSGGEQIAPFDARIANAHGVALLSLKRFDDAVAALNRALERDAKLNEARANLGLAQAFAHRRDDALRTLRDARTLGDLPPLAQAVLGYLEGDASARDVLLTFRSRPPFAELIDALLGARPNTPAPGP